MSHHRSALFFAAASAKTVAFVLGLLIWRVLASHLPEDVDLTVWPVVFWYLTIGGIIGVLNVYENESVLNIPVFWWFRAPFAAMWMNLMLIAMVPQVSDHYSVTASLFTLDSALPWFVVEGVVLGVVTGYVSCRVYRRFDC